MIIVSDTSPISNLILIHRLNLLQIIFKEVIVPPSVHKEIIALKQFGINLELYENSDWIKIMKPSDENEVQKLMNDLDAGESEAIALAKEINANLLLIDERAGTNKALAEGLTTVGLVGVLIKGKKLGIIENIAPILTQLKEDAGFWLGKKLTAIVLKEVGEI
ncbi:MAG: DUF3368 domain-containing protein [Saprospiraceae bacterium]|nr:DUF3368 domain-containing protein [Saprospiraceae bacterium]